MTKKLSGIMKKYTNNISSQVELKLPKLKKVKETI